MKCLDRQESQGNQRLPLWKSVEIVLRRRIEGKPTTSCELQPAALVPPSVSCRPATRQLSSGELGKSSRLCSTLSELVTCDIQGSV